MTQPAMTLIEALLSLPEHGEPEIASLADAIALTWSPARFVQRDGMRFSLTDVGRRFLAQFRDTGPNDISHIVVRLVVEGEVPVFHLLCDDDLLLKVRKTELRRRLQELQAANPGVEVSFDFRSSGRVS